MIRHELNPKKKGKYFTGGQRAIAAFLNSSDTTGRNVIKELLYVGAIWRGKIEKDSQGNEMFVEGKGVNAHVQTGYKVNDILIREAK